MREIIPPLNQATQDLIPMIDADTNAFNDYMDALRLPKITDEDKIIRSNAMQNGLKKAIEVPLNTMRNAFKAWSWMEEIAKYGNIASKSDVEVGVRALEVGIWGAYKNVLINLPGIKDEDFKLKIIADAENMMKISENKCKEILSILENRTA
jgi:glutamate formiminotransferase/formiminotetrahydrofolate cyclodeaminase